MYIPQNCIITPLTSRLSPAELAEQVRLSVGGEDAYLCQSARASLLLTLINWNTRNRAIWLPAFMCVSLLQTIRSVGYDVKLYDVDYNLDPILESIEPRTGECLLVPHYFGIYHALENVKSFCQTYKMLFIEDCAHILPTPGGEYVGCKGDVAIFSLRKLLPVAGGGVLCANNLQIQNYDSKITSQTRYFKKKLLMCGELLAFKMGVNFLPLKDMLRFAAGTTDSANISESMGVHATRLTNDGQGFNYIRMVALKRNDNYSYLIDCLSGMSGVSTPFQNLAGSCPQLFPITVEKPSLTIKRLRKCGVEASSWPGEDCIEFSGSRYPGAEYWKNHLVLLPVHHSLTKNHLNAMVEAL